MGVELRPLGVNCNIACQYCYQNPQRDAGNFTKLYKIEKMKEAISASGTDCFTLFGGEPLLVPEKDLEDLFAWGYEKYGKSGIQTNGTLINDSHIRMFKQFNVRIGISIDGPGELNDVRWAGSLAKTRELTRKTEVAIERLCRDGVETNLIVTLHRCNATSDKLPVMNRWLHFLDELGVASIRLHVLEVEDVAIREKYGLSTTESLHAFLNFAHIESSLRRLKLDVFSDLHHMLAAQDKGCTCVWRACDPYTTSAVQGIEGDGRQSNCGRTNKEGIDFIKSRHAGYERYIALFHTPQEYGGCNGCRFFLACKGQCPGTAINNDWRNRTEHCELWKELFTHIEQRIVSRGETPLSLHQSREAIESGMLKAWEEGTNPNLTDLINSLRSS